MSTILNQPVLGPNQPHGQVQGGNTNSIKRQGRETNNVPSPRAEVKISGDTLPLLRMRLLCTKGNSVFM